jgi:chromosome segregation ATPase
MARKFVQYEDVEEVIQGLLETGDRPTVLNIHAALGRGSYTTIGKYLKAWEESNQSRRGQSESGDQELPSVLASDAMAMFKRMWQQAVKAERLALEVERSELARREEQNELKIEGILNRAEQTYQQVEDLQAQLAETQGQLKDQTETRIQLEKELALKAAALEQSEKTVARQEQKIESLTSKHEAKLEEVTRLNSEVSRLNADIERATLAAEQEKRESERLLPESGKYRGFLRAEISKNESLSRQLEQMHEDRSHARQKLVEVERQLSDMSASHAGVMGQLMERTAQAARTENSWSWLVKLLRSSKLS